MHVHETQVFRRWQALHNAAADMPLTASKEEVLEYASVLAQRAERSGDTLYHDRDSAVSIYGSKLYREDGSVWSWRDVQGLWPSLFGFRSP